MEPTQDLTRKKCVPCSGDEPPFTRQRIEEYKPQVPDWEVKEVNDVPRLQRSFTFDDFADALTFTQQVGQSAEEQGHHPVIRTEWGKVTVSWWTHKIKGLHENDFIMAAKTDQLYQNLG